MFNTVSISKLPEFAIRVSVHHISVRSKAFDHQTHLVEGPGQPECVDPSVFFFFLNLDPSVDTEGFSFFLEYTFFSFFLGPKHFLLVGEKPTKVQNHILTRPVSTKFYSALNKPVTSLPVSSAQRVSHGPAHVTSYFGNLPDASRRFSLSFYASFFYVFVRLVFLLVFFFLFFPFFSFTVFSFYEHFQFCKLF